MSMSKQTTKGVALVTGASSGIGATYADRLAKRGYDLLLVARDQQRLEDLARRLLNETGAKVEVLKADLTQRADLLRVEQRLRTDAAISLLVNNAGIGPAGPLVGADIEQLDRMIQLNITAVNRLAVAAASAFVPRGRGVIVNIASVVALVPEIFNGTYSGTKAFVLNLTQGLHSEVAKSGVQMQAVLPGLTRTEIFERVGIDMTKFDPKMIMEVGDLVDAALVGLDQGELVTIPSLPNVDDWNTASNARMALGPNLSKDRPAERYRAPH
jgi:short-subunit dehydrogenase